MILNSPHALLDKIAQELASRPHTKRAQDDKPTPEQIHAHHQSCILVVAGPTGSGKSSLAMTLAKAFNGCIINADSIQLYKGLPILTAQPTPQDLAVVEHKMYGFLDPMACQASGWPLYNVDMWMDHVTESIKEALERGKRPIVVGGSGMYISTLCAGGLAKIPYISPQDKARFTLEAETMGFPALRQHLEHLEPAWCQRISDPQRHIRAWVVYRGTGKPLSYWHQQHHEVPPAFRHRIDILVDLPPAHLKDKVRKRWGDMQALGVMKEVDCFVRRYGTDNVLRRALGLRTLRDHILGKLSLTQCQDLYLQETQRYIKRQRTWFRHKFSPQHILTHTN